MTWDAIAEATCWLYPQEPAAVMNSCRSAPMRVPGTSRQIEENLRWTRYPHPGWICPVTSKNVMNGRVLALADSCTARVSSSQARGAGRTRERRVATPSHPLMAVIGREHLRRRLDECVRGCRVDESGLHHIGPSHGSA